MFICLFLNEFEEVGEFSKWKFSSEKNEATLYNRNLTVKNEIPKNMFSYSIEPFRCFIHLTSKSNWQFFHFQTL
jgi:hypothetical protein